MKQEKLDQLMALIHDLVHEPGLTWKERRDGVLENISPDERTDLEELAGWFEGETQ